jgi:hypothetical protein
MAPFSPQQLPPPEPVSKVKKWLRDAVVGAVQRMGPIIRDTESGQVLGRALLIPWSGKIHVIGASPVIFPRWATQKQLTYWKQEIVFSAHPPPDFPHEPTSAGAARA